MLKCKFPARRAVEPRLEEAVREVRRSLAAVERIVAALSGHEPGPTHHSLTKAPASREAAVHVPGFDRAR